MKTINPKSAQKNIDEEKWEFQIYQLKSKGVT